MFYVDSVENIRVGTMGLIKNQAKTKQNSRLLTESTGSVEMLISLP